MEHRRRGDVASDSERDRRKKRRNRSASANGKRRDRDRRRPPLHDRRGRGKGDAGHSDRSSSHRRKGRSRTRSRSRSRRKGSNGRSSRSSDRRRRTIRGPRERDDYNRRGGGGGGRRSRSRDRDRDRNRSRSRSGRRHRRQSDRRRDREVEYVMHDHRNGDHDDERHDDDDSGDSDHDDTIGSYDGKPGDYIASRYKIIREAGLGTFGRVLECLDKQRDILVAIKAVRKVDKYTDSAKIEANILQDVNDKDEHNASLCVRMYKWFEYKGHVCMVFERLGCSLYEYLKAHDYQPFPLYCVRAFAWQLLTSLEFIHSIKLIHTDLKPENILLVDGDEERTASSSTPSSSSSSGSPNGRGLAHATNGRRHEDAMEDIDSGRLTCRPPANFATKLIDFGGATYDDESKSSIINTRQYRSPEVILGLGWSFPSDIWSAGCIIAEMYIGELLFATHDNLEHVALIEKCIGTLPRHMTERAAPHAAKLFRRGRVDWPDGAANDESVDHVRRMRSLRQILRPEDAATGLLELLELMLVLDPEKRITAKEALRHPFFDGFSMRNIVPHRSNSAASS